MSMIVLERASGERQGHNALKQQRSYSQTAGRCMIAMGLRRRSRKGCWTSCTVAHATIARPHPLPNHRRHRYRHTRSHDRDLAATPVLYHREGRDAHRPGSRLSRSPAQRLQYYTGLAHARVPDDADRLLSLFNPPRTSAISDMRSGSGTYSV
jgi:hypothetical protein